MLIGSDHDIVYASCTEGGYEVVRNLVREGVEIAELVTLTEEQAATHDVAGYQSFDALADEHDAPVYHPETYSMTEADTDHFESLDADLLIVNGWQRLIPEPVLETFTRGALGVHGSAYGLPKGRGRSPMNWSIIEDRDRFLLSVIRLDAGVDSGDIVDIVKYDITEFDTIRTLYYKLSIATSEMLVDSLEPILDGTFEYTEQEGEPTYYPKRTPEDGAINWQNGTREIYDLVRAVAAPYPGAFTEHEGARIMIWEAIPFSDDFVFDEAPGTVVQSFVTTGDFVVKTADGTLLITDWEAGSWTPTEGDQLTSLGERTRVDAPEAE